MAGFPVPTIVSELEDREQISLPFGKCEKMKDVMSKPTCTNVAVWLVWLVYFIASCRLALPGDIY